MQRNSNPSECIDSVLQMYLLQNNYESIAVGKKWVSYKVIPD